MATLTVTAAQLRPLDGIEARLIPMIANVAVTKGQVVYRIASGTGKAGLARANSVTTAKIVGIATSDAAAGGSFDALYFGRLVGLDLSGLNPGTTVYLSSGTANAVDGAAASDTGNVVVPLGTVHCMTDVSDTKFLFVDIPQNAEPVALS